MSDHSEPRPDPVVAIVDQWHRRLPSLDASPLLVLGRLQRVAARCDRLLRPPFAEAGLAPGDFEVLAALRRADPPHSLSPGRLADAMLVTAGAVTKRVDRLAGAGLVTRGRSVRDGRARVVSLTPAGRRLADRLIRTHLANEAEILASLAPADQELLGRLLGTLLAAVEPDPSTTPIT